MTTQAASAATYTQRGRPIAVETVLGEDALLLTGVEGEEAISQPFHYTLDLLSTNATVDGAKLLRSKATVRVALHDGSERLIQGRISRFVQLGREEDTTRYRAELVPAIWFLGLARDYRVFADKTIQQIVTAILEEAELVEGEDFEFSLFGDYAPVRYAIQYRESPLDFVTRLLEDAGAFYFFEHSDRGHKLVITDVNSTSEYGPGTKPVRMQPAGGASVVNEDVLNEVQREQQARAGKVAVADYNFRTPSSHLLSALAGQHPEEVYEYPARFRDLRQGESAARVRLEEHESQGVLVRGWGPCRVLQAGGRFDLADHYRRELNTTYLALRTSLAVRVSGFRSGEEPGFSFAADFVAIPFDVPYRPPRVTAAPRIPGVQTATVGPAPGGEEILVDKYGRIPVQFHWDRRNKETNDPSVWARVATMWAGSSWGSVSIPRIGQEVVVEFLEGDPDRPLVIGSVYNAEQMPPHGLPSAGMVSGFKSRSTPGGGGYNEMSADDTKGKEKITIHAQYDMSTTVLHDDTQTIKNDRTITVDGKHTETIKKDTTITVSDGNYVHTVAKGNSTVNVNTGTHSHNVKGLVSETFHNAQQTTVKQDITITSTTAKITVDGKTEIVLVSGESSISLKADGTIKISGKKIEISGGDEAKLGVGNQNVTCDKTKVGVSGAAINSSAVGMHEIAGALVKIN